VKTEELDKKLQALERPRPALKPDQILATEFNYIAQTAFQANEDRARVTSFYLVSVGSFIAAILSTQLFSNPKPEVYWGFAGLFLFLALLAIATILQLIKLRKSWFDSAQALNRIKGFYIKNVKSVDLNDAFHWKVDSIPSMNKPNSLSFYLVLEVDLFGAVSFGAVYYFALLALGWVSVGPAFVLGAAYFGGIIYMYRRMLI